MLAHNKPRWSSPVELIAIVEALIGEGRNALQDVDDCEHLTSDGWRSIATADRAFLRIYDELRCHLLVGVPA